MSPKWSGGWPASIRVPEEADARAIVEIPSNLAGSLTAAGLDAGAAASCVQRFERLAAAMASGRPSSDRVRAWYVPGRIEILGKHTDYAGGRSLLCATERGFCALSAPRPDRLLAMFDGVRSSSIVLDPEQPSSDVKWATYPLTVLRRLDRNFPGRIRGIDLHFDSNLPSASGLSTSSAIIVLVLLALARENDLEATDSWTEHLRTKEDVAAYAATIENGSSFRGLAGASGVGTEGGSEDHTALLCSEAGRVAQYAFCPTRRERTIAWPDDLVFAVAFSGVAARKTGPVRDDYNRASQQVQYLLGLWRGETGRRDESLAAALASAPDALDRMRTLLRDHLGDEAATLIERLDQFVEESSVLIPSAADQLQRGAWQDLGATVARSQELAERALRNQVPETVSLVRDARTLGAIAASAFGAGFGGSVWALVGRSSAAEFLDRWQNAYAAAHPAAAAKAAFFLTTPGPGALEL